MFKKLAFVLLCGLSINSYAAGCSMMNQQLPECTVQKGVIYTDKNNPVNAFKGPFNFMNSHGVTFTENELVIVDEDVDVILNDEYLPIQGSDIKSGDIAIIRNEQGVAVFSSKVFDNLKTYKIQFEDPLKIDVFIHKNPPVKIVNDLYILMNEEYKNMPISFYGKFKIKKD